MPKSEKYRRLLQASFRFPRARRQHDANWALRGMLGTTVNPSGPRTGTCTCTWIYKVYAHARWRVRATDDRTGPNVRTTLTVSQTNQCSILYPCQHRPWSLVNMVCNSPLAHHKHHAGTLLLTSSKASQIGPLGDVCQRPMSDICAGG